MIASWFDNGHRSEGAPAEMRWAAPAQKRRGRNLRSDRTPRRLRIAIAEPEMKPAVDAGLSGFRRGRGKACVVADLARRGGIGRQLERNSIVK
jgi:hypothetical protein